MRVVMAQRPIQRLTRADKRRALLRWLQEDGLSPCSLTVAGDVRDASHMGFERMGEHKVTCPCGKGTKTVWLSEMDDWNRRKDGGETFEADDCRECPKSATTLAQVLPSPPVAPVLPANVSIRWTSNRAPSADAPGDSHHGVFINGTRTSVHVSAEAAQDHNIESISAVAEKKIRATFQAGRAPPRVSVSNADFRKA